MTLRPSHLIQTLLGLTLVFASLWAGFLVPIVEASEEDALVYNTLLLSSSNPYEVESDYEMVSTEITPSGGMSTEHRVPEDRPNPYEIRQTLTLDIRVEENQGIFFAYTMDGVGPQMSPITFPEAGTYTVELKVSIDCLEGQAISPTNCRRVDGYVPWRIVEEDPSEYPIILVHGIMGGWNPEMFGLDGKEFGGVLGEGRQVFQGTEWFELDGDDNWQSIRRALETQEQEYYQFYYDWRQDNHISSLQLSAFIQQVQQETSAEKVNIIAHSMGGLVTRKYIQSGQYRGDVARLVMAGTPNRGATSSIPLWHYGHLTTTGKEERFHGRGLNLFLDWVLTQWHPEKNSGLKPEDRKDLIQGNIEGVKPISSLEELLPQYGSWKVFTDSPGIGTVTYFPIMNQFLASLNNTDAMTNLYETNTLFVVGTKEDSTPREYHIRERVDRSVQSFIGFKEFEVGDGTVLPESALLDCEEGDWMHNECNNPSGGQWRKSYVNGDHNGLPSDRCSTILEYFARSSEGCVIDEENNEEGENTPSWFNQATQHFTKQFMNIFWTPRPILFSVASPVDIEVVTPSGLRFSKDQDEEIFNQFGVKYLSLGEEGKKIIMIPFTEEGEYEVRVTAVGEGGDYQVIVWDEEGDYPTEGSVTQGESREYTINLTYDEEQEDFIETDLTPERVNNPPVALLDEVEYSGVEREEVTFDASESYDPDGDEIQYKWDIEGLYDGEWADESTFSYLFSEPYDGVVRLTVTDGELEDTIEAEVSIRERTQTEIITDIRELVESLEGTTPLIRIYQHQWMRLIELHEHPVYQQYPQIQQVIRDSIYRTAYTLRVLHERQESMRRWWWIQPVMSEQDYITLGKIMYELELIE